MADKNLKNIISNLASNGPYLGKDFHDIDSRQWFTVDKINGDWVNLSSPYGRRFMKMDAFEDMISRSPLNEFEYDDIDGDYERSFGPVDNPKKYRAYLKWKENN